MVSLGIFILMFFALEAQWNYFAVQAQYSELQQKAFRATDMLLEGAGYPEGWNSSSVQKVGIAGGRGVIDSGKLESFVGMNYTQARDLIGVGKSEFYFNVSYSNGSLVLVNASSNASIGSYPGENSFLVSPVSRIAVYQGEIVGVNLLVYENE